MAAAIEIRSARIDCFAENSVKVLATNLFYLFHSFIHKNQKQNEKRKILYP